MTQSKTIGNLNGRWAIWFKISLIVTPMLVGGVFKYQLTLEQRMNEFAKAQAIVAATNYTQKDHNNYEIEHTKIHQHLYQQLSQIQISIVKIEKDIESIKTGA
jgi:hypothetical protein